MEICQKIIIKGLVNVAIWYLCKLESCPTIQGFCFSVLIISKGLFEGLQQ